MRGAATVALALALVAGAANVAGAQEPQRVVRKLDFEGNKAIPDELLATAIATTNSSWFARFFLVRWIGLGAKQYFDEQEFRRDVVRLDVFYRRSGYPHVQIDTAVTRSAQNVSVVFRIVEGEPTRVTGVAVGGLDTLPEEVKEETLVDLPLRQGDPFNRYVMQVTADTITRRLRDRGYPSARVFSSFETNKDANTAKVAMDVEPGHPAVVGEVKVEGTQRVEPNLVRKLLVSKPGRLYSQDELFQSQRNLYASDLFRFANVNIDSAAFKPGADSVPLLVQVNEAKRHRIRSGIGYGTEDCFRGSAAWTTRNFLGSNGRILDLTSRVSKVGVGDPFDWGLVNSICSPSKEDTVGSAKVNFYLGASIRRPAFLSPSNTISVSVFAERRSEFKVFLRQETGTTVLLRRETPKHRIPLSLAYTLSYGRTEATAVSFCASFNACTPDLVTLLRQNRVLGTLTATGTLPRVNNPLDPSRGSLASLEATLSSRYIGSSSFQQFFRTVGRLLVVLPAGAGRGTELAVAGRGDLRADRGRGHPVGQLHPARAAILRGRAQRRARLPAQRAGPGRVRGFPELLRLDLVARAAAQLRLGDRRGHRRQHPGRRQPRAASALTRVRLAAPAGRLRGRRQRLAAGLRRSPPRRSRSRPASAFASTPRWGPPGSMWPTIPTASRPARSSSSTPSAP